MCSNATLTVVVPAPEDPVTAITGCFRDMPLSFFVRPPDSILPDELSYVNDTMNKGSLGDLVFHSFRQAGLKKTTEFLDRLKDFGFRHATQAGVSIGLDDMHIPDEKREILAEAQADVDRFTKAYHRGVISFGERYNKVIDAWTHANNWRLRETGSTRST